MSKPAECSLCLELLGPFHLTVCDQVVPVASWKSRKALLLLKYLATRHGEKIPSDVLIDLLWPNEEFDTSTHNLHTTIYFIRRILKDHTPADLPYSDWILSSNGLYWLDQSEKVSVDIKDFIHYCRESERLEQTDPVQALKLGSHALKLYRGCFLAEDLYADWTSTLRENYRTKYVDLVLRISNILIDYHSDFKSATRLCKEALKHDPYREELYQLLMRCLIAMKRFPEAAFQYKVCAKILQDEFDLEPSPQTKALLKETKLAPQELINPASMKQDGVLIYDKDTFCSIVTAEQRRSERSKHPLVIMTIAMDETASLKHSRDVFCAISQSARKCDVATHWAKQLFVILLYETDYTSAEVVEKRIRSNLGSIATKCQITRHILAINDELREITQTNHWQEHSTAH